MIAKLFVILVFSLSLSACEPVVIIPAWYVSPSDHTLQCVDGECSMDSWDGRGGL